MNLLFIIDPTERLIFDRDTSLFIMRQAFKNGHSVSFCQIEDISFVDNELLTVCRQISAFEPARIVSMSSEVLLRKFDQIFVRKEPPFDQNYLNLTVLLQLLQNKSKVAVHNDPEHLQKINEKMSIFYFPEDIAPTIVSSNRQQLYNFSLHHNVTVAKKLNGMGGDAVFVIREDDKNKVLLLDTLTKHFTEKIMLQKFLPQINDVGDTRVIVVRGEVIPFGLKRLPQKNDFRSNIAAGGIGQVKPLSEKEKKIGEKVSGFFAKKPLVMIGLDIIDGYLNEINITCPSCLKQIEEGTDFTLNLADKFIQKQT
ncbi:MULTISPECIES: glutathione synthase [Candidatus Ichthyocystis]|uniref:Glutathione synthetase n=1 Tax=Candidatus Ichthyocystis hellenicum TaxID=1561003 RepID=A0A0S4M0S7_9BURK|nr:MULTISPECIES: glutathione synthase [Ichthyocystis]CUT17399.1 Glutathione synthetase [Candidatus Ichthyocystis hellenicum]